MWIQNIIHTSLFGVPLWVILLGGVCGVFIDIDHPIAHYWLTGLDGRFLHTPLLIASSIIFVGCCAYLGGLFCWMVLKGKGQ